MKEGAGDTDSEAKLRMIIDSSPDAITVIDLNGVILDCNQATVDMHGFSNKEELIGQDGYKLISPKETEKAKENMEDLLQSGIRKDHEYLLLKQDGSEFPGEVSSGIITDLEGNPSSLVIISKDITKRKRAEHALHKSEERYRTLFENASDAIFTMDEDRFIECNEMTLQIFGCERDDIIGHTPWEFSPEQQPDGSLSEKKAKELVRWAYERNVLRFYWKHMKKDGTLFDAEVSLNIMTIGNKRFLQAIVRDITERKLAEDSIHRLTAILERTTDFVSTASWDSTITYLNWAGRKLIGWDDKESYDDKSIRDIHPDWAWKIIKNEGIPEAIRNGIWKGATAVLHKDGTEIPVSQVIMSHKHPEVEYLSTIMRDISKEKEAEEALKKSEEWFRALIENSASVYTVVDAQGNAIYQSPSLERVYGWSPEETKGKSLFDRIHPDDRERALNDFQELFEKSGTIKSQELRYLHKDGSWRTIEALGANHLDNPAIKGITITSHDITERKKAEIALKESEQRFRMLFETSPDSVVVSDMEGNIVLINKQFVKMHAIKQPDKVIGRNVAEFFVKEDHPVLFEAIKKTITEGIHGITPFTMIREDGTRFSGEATSSVIIGGDGKPIGLIGIARDITERKKAEEELNERLRFETLITDLSARFINIPASEVDKEIEAALKGIVEFIGEGRIAIIQSSKDGKEFHFTHTYSVGEVKPIPPGIDIKEQFSWAAKKLFQGEYAAFSNLDELPDEAQLMKQYFINEGIKSGIAIPLNVGGSFIGSLSLTMFDKERTWPSELVNRIRLLGEIFANAIVRKRNEEALRLSEEKFSKTFHSSPNLMALFDMNNDQILEVNDSITKITGYDKEEIVGKGMNEPGFLMEEEKSRKITEQMKDKNRVRDVEIKIRKKDGEERTLSVSGETIEIGGNKFAIITAMDITERKKAEEGLRESQEKYRELVENINDIIYTVDKEGITQYISPAIERATGGFKPSDLEGQIYNQYIHPDDVERISKEFKVRISGKPGTVEYRTNTKTGEILRIRDSSRPVKKNGEIIGIQGVLRDITEYKEAEEKLRVLSSAVEQSAFPFALIDKNGIVEYMNPRLLETVNMTTEQALGKPWSSYISETTSLREQMQDITETVMNKGDIWQGEITDITENGEKFWRASKVFPIKDEHGEISHIAYFSEDITKRKKTEEALLESEEKYRNIVERANDGVIISQDGKVKFSNTRLAEILGYKVDELIGNPFLDYVYPEERDKIKDIYMRRIKGEEVPNIYEMSATNKDGKRIYVETNSGIISYQGKPAVFAFIRDITQRKQSEEALRLSEEKFSKAFYSGPDSITISTLEDGTYVDVNEAFTRLSGYKKEEVIGKTSVELNIWKDNKDRLKYTEMLEKDGHVKNLELELRNKKGEIIYVLTSAELIDYEDKPHLLTIVKDITEQKIAESALRASEERLTSFMNSASDSFYLLDSDLNFVDINIKGLEIIGKNKEDVVGKNIKDIVPDIESSGRYEKHLNVIRTGKSFEIEDFVPHPVFGDMHFILKSFKVGDGLGVIASDVTKHKKMTEELLQSEKLASIGQLAAGMAHEINTPLTNISLISANISRMTQDPEIKKKLTGLSEQGMIASKIVSSLLSFSRKIEPKIIPIDVSEVISESLTNLSEIKPDNISVHMNLHPNLNTVLADSIQLQQVFTNIIGNAYDAMPDGGILAIKTGEGDDGCVEIHITDTGTGIPKQDLEQIFDPFFTRKPSGKGVGLGLSICHGIVRAHNGTIQVNSEEGKGATFIITLPEGKK
jgi:PAS domain S-box-containing protein